MMRVVGYIRVSTETQAKHNDSLAGQRSRIQEWCKTHGHTLVKIYSEPGSSAYYDKRPIYRKMIEDLMTQHIQVEGIVVYSFSRFSRNLGEKINAQKMLSSVGVSLHSCTESVPDDPCSGFIISNIFSTMDEAQSMRNSQVVSDRMQQAAQKGYFTGSHPPYGYESVTVPGTENSTRKKVLAINSQEAEIVRKIYNYAYKGDSGIGWGIKKIAAKLNKQGSLKRGKRWTMNCVYRILKNTIYYGDRLYGLKRRRKDLGHGVIIVPSPAIIDKDLFDSVNRLMASKAPEKSGTRADISPSILTGIMKCAECGCNMVLVTGKSGKYLYYKCRNQLKSNVDICGCPILSKRLIETAIVKALEEKLLTTERIKIITTELSNEIKNSYADERRTLLTLQRKERSVISKINALYENVSDGKLELDGTLVEHLNNLKRQQSTLTANMKEVELKISMPIRRFGNKQIADFAQASKKILLKKDPSSTKAYLKAFVSVIEVSADEVVIKGGKFRLIAGISQYQSRHPDDWVPRLISNWRRGRDSNPISEKAGSGIPGNIS